MFLDDTNLFYSSNDIQDLYLTINNELQNIVKWFSTNKFSLNLGKTKYSFLHKSSKKDGIQLRLPLFSINKSEWKSASKCFKVVFDENLSWRADINIIETKIIKNIGLLFKARQYWDKEYLKKLYFFVHT